METFVMLSRVAPTAVRSPDGYVGLEREVMQHVREECPQVEWVGSFAVLGPYDYLDLFRAPDIETATRVSALVRTYGHTHTEVWPAIPWKAFKKLARSMTAPPK